MSIPISSSAGSKPLDVRTLVIPGLESAQKDRAAAETWDKLGQPNRGRDQLKRRGLSAAGHEVDIEV